MLDVYTSYCLQRHASKRPKKSYEQFCVLSVYCGTSILQDCSERNNIVYIILSLALLGLMAALLDGLQIKISQAKHEISV